jgi:hypothetical protein
VVNILMPEQDVLFSETRDFGDSSNQLVSLPCANTKNQFTIDQNVGLQ